MPYVESMSYSAEISRRQPGCIFFLIDQSTSMNLPMGGPGDESRAEHLTVAINRLLQELVVRCTKSQDEGVREYFDVGVFGYGESFGPALGGELEGQELVSIRDVAEHPLRLETMTRTVPDGKGGTTETEVRFPVWFDLDALGKTPMCRALSDAYDILAPWVESHPESFPPLVFNITDGEASDGDPRDPASRLRELKTEDGHLLLFNVHLSSIEDEPIHYPTGSSTLPDEFANQLYEMSSIMPPPVRERFAEEGYDMQDQARAFVFNADIGDVVQCLDIGTRLKMRR